MEQRKIDEDTLIISISTVFPSPFISFFLSSLLFSLPSSPFFSTVTLLIHFTDISFLQIIKSLCLLSFFFKIIQSFNLSLRTYLFFQKASFLSLNFFIEKQRNLVSLCSLKISFPNHFL